LLSEVTFDCLNSALETLLLKRANRDDVVIYFTGHGFIAGETEDDQEGYLATADCQVDLAGNRVLSQRRGLSFRRLNGLVKRANLASLVMFLDCCHSGYALEAGAVKAGLGAFQNRNSCLIAACRGFEQAYAEWEDPHSLFTGALVAGLQQPESGDITALGLFQQIKARLQGVGQEPILLHAGQDVVVVRQPHHQPIALAEDETAQPYQGLRAFTPETRRFFFGRDREIAQIVQHLGQGAVVPVIGPSGSGKSSVVRAGVVPWAQEQGWQVLEPWMPGPEPWAEVKRSFRGVFDNRAIGAVYGNLEAGNWEAVAAMWPPGPPTLMVVDQFEELFTVCIDRAERRQVLDWLAAVWQAPEPVVRVVMTMRADFVAQWLACHQLMPMIQEGTVWLGPLVGTDLERAIVGPAGCLNYQVPEELLGLILDDGAAEPNCLPLLEFALAELWQVRDRTERQLTTAAYRGMGRLQGALAQRAEAIYQTELRTERERQICRELCLALVRIGPEGVDTRRRRQWQPLLEKQVRETSRGAGAAVADCWRSYGICV
jgi:energy-coupling factor transporter ATP-binding protein EcfA2